MIRTLDPALTDAELAERVRAGDVDAFSILHERHAAVARGVARHMSHSTADADDLVAEAFARVLGALRRGGGPVASFRPYLVTTLRRVAYDRTARGRRESPVEELPDPTPPPVVVDPVEADLDRSLVVRALVTLPERWQTVLWLTEVEGLRPAEAAPRLGLAPNATAALAYRAREGLRQAFLAAHLAEADAPGCARDAPLLGAFVRGALARGPRHRVDRHLADCERCSVAVEELRAVNRLLSDAPRPGGTARGEGPTSPAPDVAPASTQASAPGAAPELVSR